MDPIHRLILAFVIICIFTTVAATDFGERIKDAWTGLWCSGSAPEPPRVLATPMPDGSMALEDMHIEYRPSCHDRVAGATGSMVALAVCLVGAYMVRSIWKNSM